MSDDETLNTILQEINNINRDIHAIKRDIAEIRLGISKTDEIKEEIFKATEALMLELRRTT